MEQLEKAASTFYTKLPPGNKQLAITAFNTMDKTGNGISLRQFIDFFKDKGLPVEFTSSDFFRAMDANGDGKLDFNEYKVVHYLLMSNKLIFCEECKVFLCGSYMSCLQCFTDASGKHYNVCDDCYQKTNIDHHKDATFVASQKLHNSVANAKSSATEFSKISPNAESSATEFSKISPGTEKTTTGHAQDFSKIYYNVLLGVSTATLVLNTAKFGEQCFEHHQSAYHTSHIPDSYSHADHTSHISDLSNYADHTSHIPDLSNHADIASGFFDHTSIIPDLCNHADIASGLSDHASTIANLSNHADIASGLSDHISSTLDAASLFFVM